VQVVSHGVKVPGEPSCDDSDVDGQWWVIALDDDLIIRDVAAFAFAKITGCGAEHAVGLTRQVHHEGRAVVAHCFTLESALDIVDELHSYGVQSVVEVVKGG
jgi:ATP-dependent Clp protease adapter protein ClpS